MISSVPLLEAQFWFVLEDYFFMVWKADNQAYEPLRSTITDASILRP